MGSSALALYTERQEKVDRQRFAGLYKLNNQEPIMEFSASTKQALAELVATDDTLREELHGVANRGEFASKLAAAAQAKGIAIDERALSRDLDLTMAQYAGLEELSEEQLNDVSGGFVISGSIAAALAIGGVAGALVTVPVAAATAATTTGAILAAVYFGTRQE